MAGREGGTFLHHIISKWGQFADHTLFMQALFADINNVQHQIGDFFVPETEILPLGLQLEVYNSSNCQDPWDKTRTFIVST